MKKTLQMLGILALFVLFGCCLFSAQNRNVQFEIDENNTLVLSLVADGSEEVLYPWVDEKSGITYYFLPSFIQNNRIYCDRIEKEEVAIDGEFLVKRQDFEWEPEIAYSIVYEGQENTVVFMKSANLPAIFLETESGSMAHINENKENEEAGNINLVKDTGSVEYQGNLKKISARGNSTFAEEKKAYTITLDKAHPLCGLESGKKWNLLAMYYEDNKIQSKLIFDMAAYLGMEYTPGCTWVDLYCNGSYQGLYLLTEAITVADGRVEIYDLDKENENTPSPSDISGGYLIEREIEERLEPAETYFITDIHNYIFTLKSPKNPTPEQTVYIKDYVQNIENALSQEDVAYKQYLDLDSFAKQFLIDKLVLNPDAMRMSTFYYKDRDSDILKAGPLWDYDRAMGISLPNYTLAIGDYPDSMKGWYSVLYADEEYYNKLVGYYQQLLPYLEDILVNKIDAYADMIGPSVAMDEILWPMDYIYHEHESYVKYLKYFLANRIAFLNETWDASGFEYEVPSIEQVHTVQFFGEDGGLLETCQIKDGACINSLPELDAETYKWRYGLNGTSYDSDYPVYEDMELYAERKFDSQEEYADYKLEMIKNESSLINYLELLADTNLSVCTFIPSDSEIYVQEDIIKALEKISTYKEPALLRSAAEAGTDYFLLVDNGWEDIWESVDDEELSELGTTFGTLSYITAADGKRQLYIQGTDVDYLPYGADGADVQFVVINRLTGEIADIAAFIMTERITME